MRDIATATLSGNLTRDVELRELPSGTEAARLSVAATTRRRNGEEWVEKTNYFTVEAYGPQARACAQRLRKGSRVVVDADLDWREWTDQQINRREAVTFRTATCCSRAAPEPPPTTTSHPSKTTRRSPPNRPWRSAQPRRRTRARPERTTSRSERPKR